MAAPDTACATLTIDLDAIAANYRLLRDRLVPAACAAVVKADGYGLGAEAIAARLIGEGCRDFFVAQFEEAVSLRRSFNRSGLDAAIYVLNGLADGAERDYAESGITPVLNRLDEIDRWAAYGRTQQKELPAILHVDTGMSRLGLTPGEIPAALDPADRMQGIDLRYVMSHLACAGEPLHPMNEEQRRLFSEILQRFGGVPGSLANSSGIFLGPQFHFSMARPGAALYGMEPLESDSKQMQQVVNLQGKILQCRFIDTGQAVGYGATHRVQRPSRIATVGAGYADGIFRSLESRACGYIGDIRVPMVGRVSMDLVTFDVTDVPESECRPGCSIELIGPHRSIDDVAADAGTIGYEILTALGRRYRRNFSGDTTWKFT
jgi:alanine racemase